MKLTVVRADPAGNITLFVLTPVDPEKRAGIAEKLMGMEEFGAEQVGYRCAPEAGFDGKMIMSGGEFCGNASRAYGYLTAQEKGIRGRAHLVLDVSGSDVPVEVDVDTDAGTARAKMPLPKLIQHMEAGGRAGVLVHLGGIAHFIVDGMEPSEEFLKTAEAEIFAGFPELDAYGVMFYDSTSGKLTPLVKVPAANSLYWEGSCGSGSLAATIALTADLPDGVYEKDMVQPAGIVHVTAERKDGAFTAAYIGGSVTIDPPAEVEV